MDSITKRIANLSPEKQRLLLSLLKKEGVAAPPIPIAARAQEANSYPLSFAQQRLWFLDQFEPGSPLYNITNAVRLVGDLNLSALNQSIGETIRRHEVLRTTFTAVDGRPVQVIHPQLDLALPVVDLSAVAEDERMAVVRRLSLREAQAPFDLSKGPLLRLTLLRIGDREHFALVTMHHIISDGWSMGILIQELSTLYNAFSKASPSSLPDLPIQYADFAIWQREMLDGDSLSADLSYWKKQLAGVPTVLELPTDHPRPAVQTFRGASQSFALSADLSQQLTELSLKHEATLFMTLLAAFKTLLYRYSGQQDFCVGTPIAGRTRIETEGLIGFFINTLALRADFSGNPSFTQMLKRVRETVVGAQVHQELPFEKLVEELQPERSLSHTPFFQAMFTLQNAPRESLKLEGLTLSASTVNSGTSRFDLNVEMGEIEGKLLGSISYNTDLFDAATITRMIGHFQTLLGSLAADPDQPVSAANFMTAAEQHQVLVEWNETQRDYRSDKCIHELFEAQAEQRPDDIALIYGAEQITYGDLNARANQLAHYLSGLGVGPEVTVGLCLERSLDLIVALLGILKAGGAYVPLEPAYPLNRLAFMLEDAAIPVLLTQESLIDKLPTYWAQVVCLDTQRGEIERESPLNLSASAAPDNLAYVIYTSGSTGQPKGVGVPHRAVARLVINNSFAELSPAHTLLQFAPVAFDASTFEIWGALLNGARLVIAAPEVESLAEITQTIKRHRVTTAWLTAGLFHLLVEAGLQDLGSLRQLLAGGDVLSANHVQRVLAELPDCTVINGYGPTEATTFSCCHRMTKASQVGSSVRIGGPIANTKVYVLDEQQRAVPLGVEGELYIAGAGLARGYLNQAGETAARFVADPFDEVGGGRMYGSGDRVRWREGGELEFVGRRDRQVKVRGYRVELAEVEERVKAARGVGEAAVEVRGEGSEKRLVGYVVWKAGEVGSVGELREGLKEKLPEYMVPSVYVEMAELPLTANGKVDRGALPEVGQERGRLEKEYVPPRTSIETKLAKIWSQVLGIQQIGIHDNFFELGGDSIISLQIVARATQAGLHLTTKHIFQCQTIAELAVMAETASLVPADQGEVTGEVELSPIQCWFFDKIPSHRHHYNQALLLATAADLDPARLRAALARLLAHHDALRARFQRRAAGWQQRIAPLQADLPLTVVDLSAVAAADQRRAIEATAAAAQASLDLANGPLLRLMLMRLAAGQGQRLLIVIHHLVVDGVSWRVLLEDLQSLYEQLSRQALAALPAKTSSYQQWSGRLREYAESAAVQAELGYWRRAQRRAVKRLPVDAAGGRNQVGDSRIVGVRLSAEETRALLQEVPGVYRTQINDVLLSALAQAFADWTGCRSLIVDQDGHGREEVLKEIDVTRTVGFFTATFPMYLEVPAGGGPGEVLKAIKEQVRELPHKGMGYGLLRYLSEDAAVRAELAGEAAEVSFNYLGQFDQVLGEGGWLRAAGEGSGASRAAQQERVHLIDVVARVVGGQLWVGWEYSEQVHRRETIERLAESYVERLREVIGHCGREEAGGYTKSDFELAAVGEEELAELYGRDRQIEDVYPLSPMQQGMLFHMLYEPASGAYFVQTSYGLRGEFNQEAFKQAWRRVIERHAVLRTSFMWEGVAEPLQVVHKRVGLPLEEADWRGKERSEQEEELSEYLERDRRRGFELTQAPLMRLTLIRMEDDFHYIIWGYHHVIADGWSGSIIQNDVLAYYRSLCRNQEASPGRARPYREYIAWLQRQDLSSAESFWRRELKGFTAPTPLGVDHLGGGELEGKRNYQSHWIRLSDKTLALARQHQLTLNTLVQGAWALILSAYSGEQDLVFGVTSSGRPAEIEGIENMVGLFINTMPQRVQVSPDAQLAAWLKAIQARQLEIRDYEYSPLLQVQGWSEIPRGANLFESILVSEKYPVPAEASEEPAREPTREVAIRDVRITEHTHYPLTIEFVAAPDLLLRIGYDCRRFDDDTIARLLGHFQAALESMGEDPQQRLSCVQFLPRAESEQLLSEWNATDSRWRLDECFHRLFEQQVERTPEAIAVSCESEQLTYRQLNERANRVARQLSLRGIGPDSLVGLLDERGNNFLTAMLAVFKAGGAYLPLDPLYPARRTRQVLEQSRTRLVLTGEKFHQELLRLLDEMPADHRPEVLMLEHLLAEQAPTDDLPTLSAPASLAYVIYTSGSTGIPKGAMVEQGGMLNHLFAKITALDLGAGDIIAQTASQSFDISVWQFLAALLVGGRVHVIKDEVVHDAPLLLAELDEQAVTIVETVPSLMRIILDEERRDRRRDGLANLRWMIPTGEALPVELCREWLKAHPRIPLMNAYGPTECSDDVTHQIIREQPASHLLRVPIGRPIQNMRMYILDDLGRPVPLGAAGELLVGGVGVGRGYLHDPVRTCESFIPDPFSPTPGARLYKTGDLARYLKDGTIEFLGRKDFQVKVRGYRIELGEIEEALCLHAGVKEAAVAVVSSAASDHRLVAYVVPALEDAPAARDLQDHLKERLPDYMVPATYVTLAALPLTPNGKVDRRALPLPEAQNVAAPDDIAPTLTPVQEMLLDIWKEVFGHERIGLSDDFFDLGGHSLLATQVISRARKTFHVDLPLRSLFDNPTIKALAVSIEEEKLATRRHKAPPVRAVARGGLLPVSFAQERLWFFHQLDPHNPFYNMPKTVHLRGPLNLDTLERTFDEMIKRHETLRTIFTNVDGQPYQIIQAAARISIPVIDLSNMPGPAREAEALRLAREESLRPFDLSRGPLLRVSLLRIGENDHILVFLVHHIASDGWSVGIFIREISAIYRALVSGESSSLPELPIQYADYAAWQRDWLQGEVLDEQLSYWRHQLEDLPVLQMPADYPRPAVPSFRGETEFLHLSPELSLALRELSRSQGVTLYMTLLAAFKVLLYHYTGQQDIVVGSAIANRTSVEAERLIGFFVNTQVMRTDLSGDPTFTELVGRVRDMALEAYANQDVPFEKVVQEVQPERYLSRMPLFQVAFSHQNIPHRRNHSVRSDLTISEMNVASGTARVDLTIYITEEPDGLSAALEYSTDLFENRTIRAILGQYRTLLEGVIANPSQRLSRLSLLSDADRHRLLVEWNDTRADFPEGEFLHRLFEAQAARTPDLPAVVFEDARLTYAELDRRANQLARHLANLGVGPDVIVGICMERSLEMVVALLGVLKAGGAYLPLDPAYPMQRLALMIEEARPPVILSQDRLAERVPWHDGLTIYLDTDWEAIAQESDDHPGVETASGNLAYVLYTSGSTGRPKGVMISHGSISNTMRWRQQTYQLTEQDRVLQNLPFSFDPSVWQFFAPLAVGGQLVMIPPGAHQDNQKIIEAIGNHQVTILQMPPSMLQLFLQEERLQDCDSLRLVMYGGEALPLAAQERFFARLGGELHNLYGPTEAAIDVTAWRCRPSNDPRNIPIGRPIANTEVYLLDPNLEPVPIGVPGELCIAGAGLARGYLKRADLTAERFIPNPFSADAGARLYRSGDLARYLPDGNLDFLGRVDHQVKVRGFRIELEEIQAIIGQHPAVKDNVVVVREDPPGDKRLVAYVVQNPQYMSAQNDGQEVEGEFDQVLHWQMLYEDSYGQTDTPGDDTFNISGWNSSYTGEPIAEQEMREWVNATVAEIATLAPRRVLEIGCGTGLLLFRVAPGCEQYVATDFSREVLKYVDERLSGPGRDLKHVTLLNRMADNFEDLASESFDTIILNSVVQYFPSINYLVRVLEQAVEAVSAGGSIFLGDIRSLPLLEAFHASVQLYQTSTTLSVQQLRQRVQKQIAMEEELVIDPQFFLALKHHLPKISHVEVRLKRGHSLNELTKFRYDVVLHIGGKGDVFDDLRWLDWQEQGLSLAAVRSLLEANDQQAIGLSRVPNARIFADARIPALLAAPGSLRMAGDLRDAFKHMVGTGIDPEALWALGEQLGYSVEMSWLGSGADGAYQAVFRRPQSPVPPSPVSFISQESLQSLAWSDYANNPLQGMYARKLVPELTGFLEERLPEYMVPSAFVLLNAVPLTSNGKVDLKALPEPDQSRSQAAGAYVAPRTPLEAKLAEIWGNVLGLEQVGIYDNFFQLGGHSLMVTQVMSRIREVFNTELPLATLFQSPTIAGLAECLELAMQSDQMRARPPIQPLPRNRDIPLSFAQQRLWFIHQLEPDSSAYNMPVAVRFQGQLNIAALEQSFNEITRRHETLRTTFSVVEGRPVQVIGQPHPVALPIIDLGHLPEQVRMSEARRLANEDAQRPFDLRRGPLLRVKLVRVAQDEHVLVVTLHHIVGDGWSLGVMVAELTSHYRALCQGQSAELPELVIQYADYAAWQRQWMTGAVLQEQLGYWQEKLGGELPVLRLAVEGRGEGEGEGRLAAVRMRLSEELSGKLKALSEREGVTLFMVLLAGFKGLLYRYSGQSDIIVGTPIAGRSQIETEGLIGFFLNTLALRTDLSGNPSFRQLLGRVREIALGAQAHQDAPYDKLIEVLQPERSLSRTPLFQVWFVLQNAPMGTLQMPGLKISTFEPRTGIAQFDLVLSMSEVGQQISGSLEYNADLFDEDTVVEMGRHLESLFLSVTADPDIRLLDIYLDSGAEFADLEHAAVETDDAESQFIF